ncbi:hypothetical protein DSO57_1038355 [Entomophthora muscae]|uniref:Uncharacterized protein n=1 Tax=Entomophthora muscae TaxID=34485 RepID=A0ACC2SMP5_9FUNG|nr:hypothetical protein DSO57_1038355 [Entomophthora muscae]
MIGFWANWAGYSYSTTNLVVFALISDYFNQWLVVLLAVLAVVMCESAVDTLQNALVSTISTMVLRNKPMVWTRMTVILLNIPPIMLSYYKFDTFLLFQVGNKITCTAALPMILGLYHPTQAIITGSCVLFASMFSLVCVMLYGFISCREISSVAFQFAFTDPYDPYSVLVAVIFSLFGIFIWLSFVCLLKYFGYNGTELSWFQPGYKKVPRGCQIIDEIENTHANSN